MEHTIYLICAIAGCTLVVVQLAFQLFGIVGDVDGDGMDHADGPGHTNGFDDGHGNLFFGILSFKALTAFAGLFGLTGLALEGGQVSGTMRVILALSAGFLGMLGVARLMLLISQLHASGTVDVRNAVGRTGIVYTRIPASGEGWGKVTVDVQGRSLELRAVTDGPELKSGRRVAVVALAGDETLKVEGI